MVELHFKVDKEEEEEEEQSGFHFFCKTLVTTLITHFIFTTFCIKTKRCSTRYHSYG